MKNLLAFAVVCWGFCQAAIAQPLEGLITYEVKIDMHRRIPPEREGMKAMIPEFSTFQMQLFFNPKEMLFKPVEVDEEEETGGAGRGMRFMRRMQGETYMNMDTKATVEIRDFMGKKFLIEGEANMLPWKITEETKTVKGYECRKASYYDEERKAQIVAWFAEQLFAPIGPERYHSLPGAILEIDVNDGESVISAQTIELRPLKKNEMKVPSGGKKTTNEEYRQMVEERMREMRQSGGGGMWMMRGGN